MPASYAVRVEDSRGRRYPEPPHPYRNAFQRDRAANVVQRFREAGAAVGQHVAEVVQRLRILGVADDDLMERLFRQFVFLLTLVDGAGDKVRVILVLLLGRHRQCFVDAGFGLGPILHAAVHLRQRDIDLAVVGSALQHGLHLFDGRAGLPHVSALRGRYQLQ